MLLLLSLEDRNAWKHRRVLFIWTASDWFLLSALTGSLKAEKMGNKFPGSRRTCASDVRDFFLRRQRADDEDDDVTPRRSNSGSGSANKKMNSSCPDLVLPPSSSSRHQNSSSRQDAEKEKEEDGARPLRLKIYRSYNDIADPKAGGTGSASFSSSEIPTLEIRVYRRSSTDSGVCGRGPCGGGGGGVGRAVSLPRGMERSLLGDGAPSEISSTGTDHRPTSRQCGGSSSRRGSSRSSMTSVGYRVTVEEFPNTETVKRKLKDFETNFVSGLVESFRCLPPLNQLAAISVATRPDRVNQSVSLLQYLESESIPADLLTESGSPDRRYVLTIPERQFQAIRRIKTDRLTDQRLGAALEILQDLARRAAAELGRIFEYQLVLIVESVSMRLLARHAVDCIIHVLKRRNRLLDRNTVIQGVLRGRPRVADHLPRYVSIIIGSKELKWNIYEVFKRPALRRELFSTGSMTESGSSRHSSSDGGPDFSSPGGSGGGTLRSAAAAAPWRFYTSSQCDPMVYGYRGQFVEWDFSGGHFQLSSDEETGMTEEVSWRYDDFHRLYCPYHRLVGLNIVDAYLEGTTSSPVEDPIRFQSLSDFVREAHSLGPYGRDEVLPVFRPLGPVDARLDLLQLGLEDAADVARIRTPDHRRHNGAAERTSSVSDTAKEVSRRCEELRSRLEDMEAPASNYSSNSSSSSSRAPLAAEDDAVPNEDHDDSQRQSISSRKYRKQYTSDRKEYYSFGEGIKVTSAVKDFSRKSIETVTDV